MGSNDVLRFCKSITNRRAIGPRRWNMASLRRTFAAVTAAFVDLVLYNQCDALPFVNDALTMPELVTTDEQIRKDNKPWTCPTRQQE